MVVNTTRITVDPDHRTELFQTIGRLLEPIKHAKGCLNFRFYVDATDENSSVLISEWETESDLDNYLHSDDFAVIKGAITVLSASINQLQGIVTSAVHSP
jgi:quinol monooxygenase YgiN